ncbi:asparagine synthase (glutamine-hydrolysing) [Roseomonas rosea]|uniref:asparagine synthase (glutamine-hydrolyzing) n=1 Tax=Muricoccus roseus TaxID=198092 RepID=A0A1M6N8K7_9PROT|nr:asparagine synthase (glutamine-hydrolyzing) [Roseomonas rosea]SHJ92038.1 asparagine synthase (glutamine-hydrolysing) [Roseomonas rosea]
MCGILGVFHPTRPRAPAFSHLRDMAAALRHRGPDGAGFHCEPNLALGHRRLAIVDLEGGVQPMSTDDAGLTVSFNGEIYNHATLRTQLEAAGHRFRTRSDTEVILHGWREWGLGVLDRLGGMFAFALWDRQRGELLLARDRLGEKPLHHAMLRDGTFAFASEIAGLLAQPELSRQLDPASVNDYLALGYIPDPATIYAGIRRLPAGHFLLLRRGEDRIPAPQRYWAPPSRVSAPAEAPAGGLETRLRRAVRDQMMSDVPLGAFLSGGMDSASVVAFAAAARAEAHGPPLRTFTIGFDGAEDERPMAARAARHFGTAHHDASGDADYLAASREVARIFGEPFGDHSAVPTMAVCAFARQQVTVALSGDGGDEILGGYRRHRWHALAEAVRGHVPGPLRRQVLGRLARAYPKLDRAPRWLRAKHTLTELSLDSALGYYRMVCKLQDERRLGLFAPAMRASLQGHDPAARFVSLMEACDPDDPLLAAGYVDLQTYLPGDILAKTDRASMAVSLELRAPMLDHRFVEWGLALPGSEKLRGGVGKWVLREGMAPHLPPELPAGPKRGFAASIAGQLRARAPELRARLSGMAMMDSGIFDRGAVLRLVDEHVSGTADHAQALWQLLVFEAFLDGEDGPLDAGLALSDPVGA